MHRQVVGCFLTWVSYVKVFRFCDGQGDVAVAALVTDSAHLSQHPHGLLARLRLHGITGQIWVTTVPGLKLLLLSPSLLSVDQNRIEGVVLIQERSGGQHQ